MITIIIPTMNRSGYVVRYLRYLAQTGFDGCVAIGDSSDAWHVERTRRFLARLRPSFEVLYEIYPGASHIVCIRDLARRVTTPYALFVGDDDFLVPRTLAACVRLLEQDPRCSGAYGAGLLFALDGPAESGAVRWTEPYRLRAVDAPAAAGRVRELFASYIVTAYAVSRTAQFRQRWRDEPDCSDRTIAAEFLPSSLLVAQGTVRMVDGLFVARQVLHAQHYAFARVSQRRGTEEWRRSAGVLCRQVGEEVARQDGVPVETAMAGVREAFDGYVESMLRAEARRTSGAAAATANPARGWARRMPAAAAAWRAVRAWLPDEASQLSLASLRRPGSRYAADMAPIFRAISEPLDGVAEQVVALVAPEAAR